MKSIKFPTLVALCVALFFSCSIEEIDTVEPPASLDQNDAVQIEIPEVDAGKLQKLGFDLANVQLEEIPSADGKTEKVYLMDDIYISVENLKKVALQSDENESSKAFIRRNIINTNIGTVFNGTRFVSIGYVPRRSSAPGNPLIPKTAAERRALARAVNTINNSGLRMWLVIQPDSANNEISISGGIQPGFPGGSAPIPVNGHFTSNFIFANAPNERDLGGILMHEIMHNMGYRHSDFRTRRSCVLAGISDRNDPEDLGDARPISGTNTNGSNVNSVMSACWIGNFNMFREDVNALRAIYGR